MNGGSQLPQRYRIKVLELHTLSVYPLAVHVGPIGAFRVEQPLALPAGSIARVLGRYQDMLNNQLVAWIAPDAGLSRG